MEDENEDEKEEGSRGCKLKKAHLDLQNRVLTLDILRVQTGPRAGAYGLGKPPAGVARRPVQSRTRNVLEN